MYRKLFRLMFCLMPLFAIGGCSNSSSSEYPVIKFDKDSAKDLFSVYPVSEEIILDTPIGLSDTKLIVNGSDYYVLARYEGSVVRFDKNGKLVREYGAIGRGPGEYTSPTDFIVDKISGNVEVLSSSLEKIYVYNSDGLFLKDIPVTGIAYSFAKRNENEYVMAKGPAHEELGELGTAQVYKMDASGNITDKFLAIENNALPFPMNDNSIQETNGKIHYKSWFSDKIYDVTGDEPGIVAAVDFAGHCLTEQMLIDGKSMEDLMNYMVALGEFYTIKSYLENDKYIYINLTESNTFHLIYNKKSGESVTYSHPENRTITGAQYLSKDNKLYFIGEKEDDSSIIIINL